VTTRDKSPARPSRRRGASARAGAPARRAGRPWLRRLSWVCFAVMALLLAEGALVLTWKEPITSYLQSRAQASLRGELEDVLAATPAQRVIRAAPRGPAADAAPPVSRREARRHLAALAIGDAVARLEIPSIGVTQAVIEGTDSDRLRRAPGHYPETSLPGLGRTTAIAGHRTTWGAPFRNLDDLRSGDLVRLRMPYGVSSYRVIAVRVVDDQDFSILREVGRDRLVLTACHPLYAASERLVVYAELEGERTPARGLELSGRPL
jgi:sortase A